MICRHDKVGISIAEMGLDKFIPSEGIPDRDFVERLVGNCKMSRFRCQRNIALRFTRMFALDCFYWIVDFEEMLHLHRCG